MDRDRWITGSLDSGRTRSRWNRERMDLTGRRVVITGQDRGRRDSGRWDRGRTEIGYR